MYGNNEVLANSAACEKVSDNRLHNPTVGENLEIRIKVLKEELARLEASRETLKPLLEMRIRDIRDAMNY
jgi:uncharacterized small protein (DUF1192 family)